MASPMFGATGDSEIERLHIPVETLPEILRRPPGVGTPGINPSAGKVSPANPLGTSFDLQQRGGMVKTPQISAGVTPIGKFAVILLLFALAILFLPKGVRGWFVIVILLGAFAANPGAIEEFRGWLGL